MNRFTGTATGKIILSGEYAMLFGHAGIALPSKQQVHAEYRPDGKERLTVIWGKDTLHPEWAMYAGQAAELACRMAGLEEPTGRLFVETDLPLGKGMGSSTAVVIAVCRAICGKECREIALAVENELNPGNSGMDFSVIWEGRPIVFRCGKEPVPANLPPDLLDRIALIDSGMPDETTPSLVAWIRSREKELQEPIGMIGTCTERLLAGEPLAQVMRDHHKAQLKLGIVPPHAEAMIAELEARGLSAKIIGAGGRSGGGGMILCLHD